MKRGSSILKFLNQIPPPLARILARDRSSRGKPISIADIAKAGGLSIHRASWIAQQKGWDRVRVEHVEAFLKGCGITLDRWSQEKQYLRRTKRSQTPLIHLEGLATDEKVSVLKNLKS